MALLTLPTPDVPIGQSPNSGEPIRIDPIWYRKFTEWLKKTNQDSLSTNGKLTVTATSDTNIRLSYLGSDGVTRTADITLTP
jgi:hypothetical protein